MVIISRINNQICLSGLDELSRDVIKKSLSLPNPQYKTMIKLGKPVWYVKKYIEYFKEDYQGLWCGRGCEEGVVKYLKDKQIGYSIIDARLDISCEKKVLSSIKLRDYQNQVIEDIQGKDQGVLKLSTGYGKSVLGIKIFEILNTPTLIITPRTHLRDQFKEEIEKYFDFKPYIIGSKKPYNNEPITLATIQALNSMKKKGQLQEWRDRIGMLICDEAHGYITKKALAVIHSFNPKYLFGMTATPQREDYQTDAIFFTFGKIISEHTLPSAKPRVFEYKVRAKTPVLEYVDMINSHIENDERNKEIADIVHQKVKEGRKVIVLVKRVSHIELLYKKLNVGGIIKVYANNKDKSEVLSDLKRGNREFNVVLGTVSLLSTGLDIPQLDCLVIACDLKSSLLTVQGTGRVTRLLEGKKDPIIVDMRDSNPILNRQYMARRRVYCENGWCISDYN